jgi:hypothetical protein
VTEERETTNEKATSTNLGSVFSKVERPGYSLGLTARTSLTELKPVYGLEAGRRMVGDLWLTVGIDSERNVTGGITWHF